MYGLISTETLGRLVSGLTTPRAVCDALAVVDALPVALAKELRQDDHAAALAIQSESMEEARQYCRTVILSLFCLNEVAAGSGRPPEMDSPESIARVLARSHEVAIQATRRSSQIDRLLEDAVARGSAGPTNVGEGQGF